MAIEGPVQVVGGGPVGPTPGIVPARRQPPSLRRSSGAVGMVTVFGSV